KINGKLLVNLEEETDNPELHEQNFKKMKKELKLKKKKKVLSEYHNFENHGVLKVEIIFY
ncbi:MAG: hypothetical protein AB8G86_13775, partial [Saprospiraceae bacterium]